MKLVALAMPSLILTSPPISSFLLVQGLLKIQAF